MSFTSTFPLLAHKKHSSLGVTGTEVSRLRPPSSHTFSTSWSLLKSTLMRCTPSQGTLDIAWPLVEGVLRQFKVLLLGDLVVSGCLGDKSGESVLACHQKKEVRMEFWPQAGRTAATHLVFWSLLWRRRNRVDQWLFDGFGFNCRRDSTWIRD